MSQKNAKQKAQVAAEQGTHEAQGLDDVDRTGHDKVEDQMISMTRENVARLTQMRQWHADRIALIERALGELALEPEPEKGTQPKHSKGGIVGGALPANPGMRK